MKLETRICKKSNDNSNAISSIISIYDMLYQPILGQIIRINSVDYVVISIEDAAYEDAIYRYVYVK